MRRGNVMARQRMIVLYDRSAAFDALVIGTSNKTEALLGYGTLHGDMAAAFAPIGDLYKTQLRAVATELGVPGEILDKPPSADLWPGQTDEGELGRSYDLLDRALFALVDRRWTVDRCVAAGLDRALVEWVARAWRRWSSSASRRRWRSSRCARRGSTTSTRADGRAPAAGRPVGKRPGKRPIRPLACPSSGRPRPGALVDGRSHRMNKVMLVGRLTRDPELRSLPSGKHVATFTIATNEFRGGNAERTEYHPCVAWDRLAEITGQFLSKGQLVDVEGRLQTRQWDDDAGQAPLEDRGRGGVAGDALRPLQEGVRQGGPGRPPTTPPRPARPRRTARSRSRPRGRRRDVIRRPSGDGASPPAPSPEPFNPRGFPTNRLAAF